MIRAIAAALFLLSFSAVSSADEPETVAIPAGKAVVGSNMAELKGQLLNPRARESWFADEAPQRVVDVGAFRIDVKEVTNIRFAALFPNKVFPPNFKEHPAVNVTWVEAEKFCSSVGGRLPTEEEWERAARGDKGLIYPWGNSFDPRNAVYVDSEGDGAKLKVGSFEIEESGSSMLGGTRPVGSIESGKSPFGLYDMAGNVWEWVGGWYDEGKGLRLLKGGSWLTPSDSVRSSTRLGDIEKSRFNDYGFRCAYDIQK